MIRILITGDRDWSNRSLIYDVLSRHVESFPNDRVIVTEGEADGADKISAWAAYDLSAHFDVVVDPHPARWYRENPKQPGRTFFFKGAGPERNDEMLNLKDPPPTVVLAFHNKLDESKGTRHCVIGAIKRGFLVKLHAEYGSTEIVPGDQGTPEQVLERAIQRLTPLSW
jgi:YspA, cpYpsA-related SLOG family